MSEQPDNIKKEDNYIVVESPKNTMGLTGFIISIIALFTGWLPVIGWLIWALGALLSIIGLFKKPRGFAIAGTVISFIVVIILLVIAAVLGGGAAAVSQMN